jgi:hypothetical protein
MQELKISCRVGPESNIVNWVSIRDLLTNPFSGLFYNLKLPTANGKVDSCKNLMG